MCGLIAMLVRKITWNKKCKKVNTHKTFFFLMERALFFKAIFWTHFVTFLHI